MGHFLYKRRVGQNAELRAQRSTDSLAELRGAFVCELSLGSLDGKVSRGRRTSMSPGRGKCSTQHVQESTRLTGDR